MYVPRVNSLSLCEAGVLQVSVKSENKDFLKQFEKKFPDKETPILIGCSNGTAYSMDALEQCALPPSSGGEWALGCNSPVMIAPWLSSLACTNSR